MFIVCVLFAWRTLHAHAEARVHCEDSNATPWVALGYSCPVKCSSIRRAVERLKFMDYKQIWDEEKLRRQKLTESNVKLLLHEFGGAGGEGARSEQVKPSKKHTALSKRRAHPDLRARRQLTRVEGPNSGAGAGGNNTSIGKQHRDVAAHTHYSLDLKIEPTPDIEHKTNNKFASAAARAYENIMATHALGNGTCWRLETNSSEVFITQTENSCARRNNYDFLRTLTSAINKYSKSSFKFTEDMTELILQKLYGDKLDLRHGAFDVGKLLRYLRQAKRAHQGHRLKDTTIVLKPRHCLSISVPGCFCKPGFVESSGQCVRPVDCLNGDSHEEYLTRIIVY